MTPPVHLLPMKALFLFPFRLVAFCIRLIIGLITVPLIILLRLLAIAMPETASALQRMISTFANVFRF